MKQIAQDYVDDIKLVRQAYQFDVAGGANEEGDEAGGYFSATKAWTQSNTYFTSDSTPR